MRKINILWARLPWFLILAIALPLLYALLMLVSFDNFGVAVRFFNEPASRLVYAARGMWAMESSLPYRDIFSEYPQVATYFFGLPYGIIRLVFPRAFPITIYYMVVFSLLMAFLVTASMLLLAKLRRYVSAAAESSAAKWYPLLLCLPGALYHAVNHFDILPAFLGLLSLYFLAKERWKTAAAVLALGVLTKWYLALFMPVYLVYVISRSSKTLPWLKKVKDNAKILLGMLVSFTLICAALLLTTYLSAGVDALMVPYVFHAGRGAESGSLLYFFDTLFNGLFQIRLASPPVLSLFFLLQFSSVPFVLLSRIDSFEKVICWSGISIAVFQVFAKFYSPQWWIWLLPLLILALPGNRPHRAIFYIVIFDLLTYLNFPFLIDTFGMGSKIYIASMALLGVLLIYFIYDLYRTRNPIRFR